MGKKLKSAKFVKSGKKSRLMELCRKFVRDNEIACPEAIQQCDHVLNEAPEFIEGVCKIVGYHARE